MFAPPHPTPALFCLNYYVQARVFIVSILVLKNLFLFLFSFRLLKGYRYLANIFYTRSYW